MFNKTKYSQTLNFLKSMVKRIKIVVSKILSSQGFNRPNDKKIYSIYQGLLGRNPDTDELLHWKISGDKIDDIRDALLLSYEYEQKRINQQRVLVDIQNYKIYAMISDTEVGRGIIQSKMYEPHVTNILKEILNLGDVFIDLGANIGYFSLLAASIVQNSGKVIVFEPNIQNLQLLYASILENEFNNIKVYPFAASDNFQILKLTSFGSNGFLEKPQSSHMNSQFLQSVIVDEVLQNEKKIDIVKMDIEGYEPLALRGMDKIVKKHKPIIISEFSPWHIKQRTQIEPEEYLKQLIQYGYDLYIIEISGHTIFAPDTDFVMNFWGKYNNDKQHLDLIAQPSEQRRHILQQSWPKTVNQLVDSDRVKEIHANSQSHRNKVLSLFRTSLGNYYLPTDISTDIIVNEMKAGRIFEPEIVQVAKQYITKGSTAIDVGANFGQMTLIFSELVGEQGQVYSFEADDFIFNVLQRNIAANNRHNIIPICKAVYDKDSEVVFYPVPDFKRFGSYGSYGIDPNAQDGRQIETITIDSLNIQTPISFMKVDVQGSDLFALRGALETIKRYQMPIIFEYEEQFQNEFHTSFKDHLEFIDSINYKIEKVIYEINYLILPKIKY